MLRDLKCLYVALKNNEVVFYETNLLAFITGLKKIEPDIKGYSYYNKLFKTEKIIDYTNKNSKETYFFQKVL